MALLAIETATRQMGVAVIDGDQVIASFELLADYPHAVELPDAVKRVLQAAKLTLNQLEGFIVDIGRVRLPGCASAWLLSKPWLTCLRNQLSRFLL